MDNHYKKSNTTTKRSKTTTKTLVYLVIKLIEHLLRWNLLLCLNFLSNYRLLDLETHKLSFFPFESKAIMLIFLYFPLWHQIFLQSCLIPFFSNGGGGSKGTSRPTIPAYSKTGSMWALTSPPSNQSCCSCSADDGVCGYLSIDGNRWDCYWRDRDGEVFCKRSEI